MLLKLKVEKGWAGEIGKENINANTVNDYNLPLTYEDKEFIKQNVFKTLDTVQNPTIRYSFELLTVQLRSAFEHIIFNIAECDFPEKF